MKQTLIIGSSSSIAEPLLQRLLSNNFRILKGGRDPSANDVTIDLSLNAISFPKGIDTVIHCAAAFKENTDGEKIEIEHINSLGTLKVCVAAKEAGAKHIVFLSSIYSTVKSYIYSNTNNSNHGFYSISKRHAEELAVYYCDSNNIPLTILRPGPLYGNTIKHQPLLQTIIERAKAGEDICFNGSYDSLRNYLHVEDLAEVIYRVVRQAHKGKYQCLFPKNFRLTEIASAAQQAFGKGGKIVFDPEKADIVSNIFNIDTRLYEGIGFYPVIDIADGMRKIYEYHQKYSS